MLDGKCPRNNIARRAKGDPKTNGWTEIRREHLIPFEPRKRTTCQVRACVFATGFRIDCICPALYLRRHGCGKPDPRHTCLLCRTGKGSKDHSTRANSDRLRVERWSFHPHQNLWVKPWSTILTTNGGKGRIIFPGRTSVRSIMHSGKRSVYGMALLQLEPKETCDLIARCRKNGVTIISALTTAFLAARQEVLAPLPEEKRTIGIPFDLRRHLRRGFRGSVLLFCRRLNLLFS